MTMNNLDGSTKTEMSFGSENKTVHSTIKFDQDSFRVLNKDGSLAKLHVAQGTTSDSAVQLGYLESEMTRLEREQNKIVSSNDDNMIHYNQDAGTLGVNNVTADRITGLNPSKVVITDEDGQLTTSSVGKAQLKKLVNVPEDTQTELAQKANAVHTHTIEDVEDLSEQLDSKALAEHTHLSSDITDLQNANVHHADYADEADSAKTDINGTPIADYVRNVEINGRKITVTKGNGDIKTTQFVRVMTPATEDADGKAGLVPAPCRADAGKFLSSDGTWDTPKASLEDSGITLTPEEVNGIPAKIDEVSGKVDEVSKTIDTTKEELTTQISSVETKVDNVTTALDEKADATHTHEIGDITNLQQNLTELNDQIAENGKDLGNLSALVDTKANQEHTHEISDVNGLQDALDEKALQDHDHTISQISDIADAHVAEAVKATQDVNGKALTDYVTDVTADGSNLKIAKGDGSSSTVVISTEGTYSEFKGASADAAGSVGLVPAPAAGDQNKVLSGAGTWVDAPTPNLGDAGITASPEELNYMTGVTSPVQDQLNAKAAAVHTHTASEITDFDESAKAALADELGAKADATHTHTADQITDLQDKLDEKADATHTHTISEVTDISDAVVAEANKATNDKNGKDIATYVADVTSEESKIKVTKGDGSSTEITLPEVPEYNAFTGATAEAEGTMGFVPAPAMGDQNKFLKADGTWGTPEDHDTTYEVATTETAGLVKASSEIDVSADGEMTVKEIPQSKVTGLEDSFAKMSQATNGFEVTEGTFEDTRVAYRDNEVRMMFSETTPWVFTLADGSDPSKYYVALRAYAPENATNYKVAMAEEISSEPLQEFTGENAGTDEMGRKYVQVLLPVAEYNSEDASWTYYGASSSDGTFMGWYLTLEWYANGKVIGSKTVRVNLANEENFNQYVPGYMTDYAKTADVASSLKGKADAVHTHTISDITDIADASVAEAVKATTDKNDKDLTEYVSDVTLEDSKIKVTKGDGSSSEIQLPEGTAYADFTGTDGDTAGKAGLVPAPQTTDSGKFLSADGTWKTVETSDVTVEIATNDKAGIVKGSSEINVGADGALSVTSIEQSKVTGLEAALSEKAEATHTHTADQVTDLQDKLDEKANATHTHAMSDVTDLDTTLAGKADSVHTHSMDDITELNSTLAGKADATHNHTISEITDIANAEVAAATKATQDTNGKAITDYVADVVSEDSKIKVTKGDGSSTEITLPEGTVYSNFTGSSAEKEGSAGLVPAPAMGDQNKFLKADGTWGTPEDHDTTYEVATTETAGLVKASAEISVAGDGTMSIAAVDQSKVTGLTEALAGKANDEHGHVLEDITDLTVTAEQLNGLPEAVANKAEIDHTHEAADITDLSDTIDSKLTGYAKTEDLTSATVATAGKVSNAVTVTFNGGTEAENTVTYDGSSAQTVDITADKIGAAKVGHTHTASEITDFDESAKTALTEELAGKADSTHTHTADQITDLSDKLAEKADATHTHKIANVTGLQDALNQKLEADDLKIATNDTTGMVKGSSEINVGADGALTVTAIDQTKVTGLDTALADKANVSHEHTISEISDIADAKVAEATKATTDKNDKDLTEYVSDVTLNDTTIKVSKGDGSSSEIHLPEGTVYGDFTGTTGTEAGKSGLVPAPQTTDTNKFLSADGTWKEVTVDDATVDIATSEKAGIVKASSEISVDGEGTMTISAIDQSKVTGLTDALSGKADSTHIHAISDVTDLQTTLDKKLEATTLPIATNEATGVVKGSTEISVGSDGAMSIGTVEMTKVNGLESALENKADATHTHTISEVTDIADAHVAEAAKTTNALKVTFNGADDGSAVTFDGSTAQTVDLTADKIGAAAKTHSHETSEITGLDTALSGKSNVGHTHETSEINGLDTALSEKANATHSHSIDQVTDLQTKLDEKLNKSDLTIATGDATGVVKGSAEIAVGDDGALSVTAIEQSKVTGLVDALGDKASAEHTHTTADITDMTETLATKANAVHTHNISEITDLYNAEVAEAQKATNDKNDKDITSYVADVTSEESKIKVTKGDGSSTEITLPEGTVYNAFTGATTEAGGKTGLVPAPAMGDQDKFLKADGTWGTVSIPSVSIATGEAAGIVKPNTTEFTIGAEDGALSINAIDQSKVTGLDTALSGKADSTHTHTADQITDLQDKLDAKLDSADLVVATNDTTGTVKGSSEINVGADGALTVTAIEQSKVTGLETALSEKAASEHTHTISEISDIADAKVAEATKASQDENANPIASTYVKELSLSGSTLTVKKGDDSSSQIELPAGGEGGATYEDFTGTTGTEAGKSGLVPAPQTDDADKFLASDGTWKVVQGASGDVKVLYTSQVPTTAAVGGIEEGYVPPSKGIDILDLIYNLLHPYVAPTITATMVPRNGGTVGVATTQNVTAVRVNLASTGGNQIMSYQVYDVDSDFESSVALGELWADDYENGFATGAQNVTLNSPYSITADSPHKYLTIVATDLNGRTTVVKTASFTFVETYYWGTLPEGTPCTAENILADSDKGSSASAKGTKVVTVSPDNGYLYFCAPKSYGELKSIKDQNSFENFDGFNQYKTELTINGREYYVYHNDAFSGEMTFTFSY